MAKRRFTEHERVAVYDAHGGTCQYCLRLCSLEEMHVDHIIPESLLEHPDELRAVLVAFGLPLDFDLNSFENWAPTHPKCNIRKSDERFDATPLMQGVLKRARQTGEVADKLARTAVTKAAIARAESLLVRAAERGDLTKTDIERLSDRLVAAAAPDHLLFMNALAVNFLSYEKDAILKFSGGGIHYDLRLSFTDGVPTVKASATARVDIKVGDVLCQAVELRLDVSSDEEPVYSAKFGPTFLLNDVEDGRFGVDLTVIKDE